MFLPPARIKQQARTHIWGAAFVGLPGVVLLAFAPLVPVPSAGVLALAIVGTVLALAAVPFLFAARRACADLAAARRVQAQQRDARMAQYHGLARGLDARSQGVRAA